MKIAMVTEYFWPYDLGGSEWSTYYLASELIKKGHQVVLITPNYGTNPKDVYKKINIIRFPFIKKIKDNKPVSPYWHTGLPWLILSTFYLIKICRREKPDVIHLQGKYFAPAGFLVKVILKVPVILTLRDYQLICPYGFCLWDKTKACGIFEYFTKDFPFYIKNYSKKPNLLSTPLNFLFAVNSRLTKNFYSFFAKRLNLVICISKAQARIYKENGYRKITVIYNSMDFSKNNLKKTPKKQIVFAGRLTLGKGPHLLFKSLPAVFNRLENINVVVAGDGILANELRNIAKANNFEKKVSFMGQVKHEKLLKIYNESLLTVSPSIWPEPFGRVALESLSVGTPVVVTDKGGLKEIVDNSVTGYVVEPTPQSLSKAIISAIEKNETLRMNIKKNYDKLRNKFQEENIKGYIKIYKNLI